MGNNFRHRLTRPSWLRRLSSVIQTGSAREYFKRCSSIMASLLIKLNKLVPWNCETQILIQTASSLRRLRLVTVYGLFSKILRQLPKIASAVVKTRPAMFSVYPSNLNAVTTVRDYRRWLPGLNPVSSTNPGFTVNRLSEICRLKYRKFSTIPRRRYRTCDPIGPASRPTQYANERLIDDKDRRQSPWSLVGLNRSSAHGARSVRARSLFVRKF